MGLIDALRVGLSGLNTAQAGLEAAQNNVANVNTPGYARLRANLEEVVLATDPTLSIPGGARVASFQSLRSALLDQRVAAAESGLAGTDAAIGYLGRLEDLVAPGGVSAIGERLNAFSGALVRLGARPEDPALRAAALDAASSLATQVRGLGDSLATLQAQAQDDLATHAVRANDLASSLADLNRQLASTGEGTAGRAAVLNRRTAVVNELAKEVDVRSYSDAEGRLYVTLADGSALVSGNRAFALAVDPAPGGAVTLAGRDVTASITGGAIGGVLHARDATIVPALLRLDAIATSLATAVNTQSQAGFDLAGAAGGDVFTPGIGAQPGTQARGFALALASGDQIAAAATAAPGDGNNATALAAAAASLTAAVGQLSYRAGADAARAADERGAAEALRAQAVAGREELSGVSLDEEAADMIRYQRAYQASSRFLQTVNDLLGELLSSVGR